MFEAYQRLVFTAALRLCGRWADAEDLTGDTVLRKLDGLSERQLRTSHAGHLDVIRELTDGVVGE